MKLLTVLFAALLIFGCAEKKDTNSGTETKETADAVKLPEGLFVKSIDGAVSVVEARKLKAGDKVTVKGKVMGALKVFVDNRALMIIGDTGILTSCDDRPGDDCPNPWDVCCDDEKDIKDGILSVQVLGADGKVLKTGLKGKGGLKELSYVIIKGTVSTDSTADSMTINADSIALTEKPKKK